MSLLNTSLEDNSEMAAPKYKLTYFNGKGRGETARLLFVAAGKKFEDDRIEFKDWPEKKKTTPQGSLPILNVDGKITACQSNAIYRYLAREFGLYGKNNTEALYIDEIVETACDMFLKFIEAAFAPDDKKADLMAKFTSEIAPTKLEQLEKLIISRGKNGYAVASALSLADLQLFSYIENTKLESTLSKYPKLKANRETVAANKNVAAYLKTRPDTQF